MARPRRDEMQHDNRREDLILAAARLFRQKGYHGTSMRDIAAATNMQSGSPFYHFATKQELLFAGVERGLLVCLETLESIEARKLAPEAHFRSLVRTHVDHLLGDRAGITPLVADEWRHLEGEHRALIVALRRRYELLWLNALRRLQQAGLVGSADKVECFFFLGALHALYDWYQPDGALSPREIADRLVDSIIGGGFAQTRNHP